MPTADLRDLDVLVLDCQSTGASPSHGHLLEIGWVRARADATHGCEDIVAHLVRLPEGARIPGPVRRITGVGDADMQLARAPDEVWAELAHAVERTAILPAPTVIHFGRFEEPFLRDLQQRHAQGTAFPFDIICTHAIARRLLPDLPRLGLRALAGYFGRQGEELKRSASHVEATTFVWHHVVHMLATDHHVTTMPQLRAWLEHDAPARGGVRIYPMPRPKRLALPDTPGVYRFLDAAGHLLYVGKATSLRRRVNSYFQKQRGISERALEMLTAARDLDVTPVATPLEAALLETDEIKRHLPPYNRALVVDRRSVWFCDASLRRLSPRATVTCGLGPFGGRSLPRAMAALLRILATPDDAAPADVRAALPGRSLEGVPEPACFAEGRARFVTKLASVIGSRRDLPALLAFGHHAWPEVAAAMAGDDEDIDVIADDDQPAWDPPRVTDALVELTARFAHALRRARWLAQLSESTIAYTDTGLVAPKCRMLHLRGGALADQHDADIDDVLPIPTGAERTWRARRSSFDLVTLDRLRVLTAELRRLVVAGQAVFIRFGPGSPMPSDRVRRALTWV